MTEHCIAEDIETKSTEIEKKTSTDVGLLGPVNAIEAFSFKGCDPFIEKIRTLVADKKKSMDISTEKGRREANSFAREIGASKAFLDEAGKKLKAEYQTAITPIDGERKRMRDIVDSIRDDYLAPLIEWEEKQQARKEAHEYALTNVRLIALLPGQHPRSTTSEEIRERIEDLKPFRQRDWEEFSTRAGREIGRRREVVERRTPTGRIPRSRRTPTPPRASQGGHPTAQGPRSTRSQREATEKAEREVEAAGGRIGRKGQGGLGSGGSREAEGYSRCGGRQR